MYTERPLSQQRAHIAIPPAHSLVRQRARWQARDGPPVVRVGFVERIELGHLGIREHEAGLAVGRAGDPQVLLDVLHAGGARDDRDTMLQRPVRMAKSADHGESLGPQIHGAWLGQKTLWWSGPQM